MSSYGKAGIRKDAWQHWQDEMLGNLVKEYERTGKTQAEAFEVAAPMVGKSASSCQQRWHGELKHKHWAYEPGKTIPIKPPEPEKPAEVEQSEYESSDIEFSAEKSDGMYKISIYANDSSKNRPIIKRVLDIIRELTG